MRRTLVAAGSFALLLGSATAASGSVDEPDSGSPADPVVVASGLDNPRQLNWSGHTLLIAEGGQGGDNCAPAPPEAEAPADPAADPATDPDTEPAADPGTDPAAPVVESAAPVVESAAPVEEPAAPADPATPDPTTPEPTIPEPTAPDPTTPDVGSGDRPTSDTDDDGICDGFTGAISAIERPGRVVDGQAEQIVDGLYSVETAEGTVGSDGVAATLSPGVLLIAQGEGTPDALAAPGIETDDPAAETQEHLLISVDGEVFPWVDFGEEETRLNPDGKGDTDVPPDGETNYDSNPNAVIVVDPTPFGQPEVDEYALVADAGANTVWKVTPDFAHPGENGLPGYTVTVFAAYSAVDENAPEFVPSALDQDEEGNIYVGGVGSVQPGAAEVVAYRDNGAEPAVELDRWGGFTAINGLAVEPDGEHVYVSQILGNDPAAPPATPGAFPGNVIRFDTDDGDYATVDVPFPSGLALGRYGSLYVSAYSTFPAAADAATPGGQVWRISFDGVEESGRLPVTEPPAATPPAATPPATTAPDDGTADQGSGDVAP